MKVSAFIRSTTFWITASLVFGGCALNRKGGLGCPDDGQIACSVHKIDYTFNTLANRYQFDGSCTLYDDESKGKLGNPRLDFVAKGEYLKTTKQFLENVEVDSKNHPLNDDNHESWSMRGIAPLDPWLNPKSIVVVTHIWGNPKAFADGLCLEDIPKPFRQLPFSRNVVLHQMDLKEKLQMQIEAAYPADPKIRFPSASSCDAERRVAAPTVVAPPLGVVFQPDGLAAYVELHSQCGADKVDYTGSRYQLRFERWVGGDEWKGFAAPTVAMKAFPGGGSYGAETLPLDAQGVVRMRARHIMKLKGAEGVAFTGAWSHWRTFELEDASDMNAKLQRGVHLPFKVDGSKAPKSLNGLVLPKIRFVPGGVGAGSKPEPKAAQMERPLQQQLRPELKDPGQE